MCTIRVGYVYLRNEVLELLFYDFVKIFCKTTSNCTLFCLRWYYVWFSKFFLTSISFPRLSTIKLQKCVHNTIRLQTPYLFEHDCWKSFTSSTHNFQITKLLLDVVLYFMYQLFLVKHDSKKKIHQLCGIEVWNFTKGIDLSFST